MTRAHWQALRDEIRLRIAHLRLFADPGGDERERAQARERIHELQWLSARMTEIRDRRKRRHGRAHEEVTTP